MLFPELEERFHKARRALDGATSETIIERCRQYLALLAEYRSELYKLADTLGDSLRSVGSSSREDFVSIRREVRVAIEEFTEEHNRTVTLLHSFTKVSGYNAVATLNRQKYRGRDNWELRASGVRFGGGSHADLMTIQEAVDMASLLRREEYIAGNSTPSASEPNNLTGISGPKAQSL